MLHAARTCIRVRFPSSLVCIVLATAVCAPEASAQVSKIERDLALQMLKEVRRDLQKHYYDPTFRGIDMKAKFAAAGEQLRAAASMTEVTGILADLLYELKDSHTRFVLPERSVRVDYGWRMRMIGDAAYVVHVEKGSDAATKGLQPGDRVLRLNRYEPTRENLWWLRYYYRAVRPQAQQRLVVRKPDRRELAYDVASRTTERSFPQFVDLVDEVLESVRLQNEPHEFREVGREIVVWKLPGFGDVGRLDPPLKRARQFKSLIIDLRNNGGGFVDTLKKLVSLTFDRDVTIAVEQTRDGSKTETAKPVKDRFNGPIVALIDSDTASAAEVFSRLLQIEKRGIVVGDRSAGAVMTSRFFPHEAGLGSVVFFGASITVADMRMSDGGSLEHVGVTPDELVLPSAADLQAGHDPVLSRAVARLGGSLTPEQAGRLFEDKKGSD